MEKKRAELEKERAGRGRETEAKKREEQTQRRAEPSNSQTSKNVQHLRSKHQRRETSCCSQASTAQECRLGMDTRWISSKREKSRPPKQGDAEQGHRSIAHHTPACKRQGGYKAGSHSGLKVRRAKSAAKNPKLPISLDSRFGGMERNECHMFSMRVVKHNGSDKQCVPGMSATSSMMACFSVLFIVCHLI